MLLVYLLPNKILPGIHFLSRMLVLTENVLLFLFKTNRFRGVSVHFMTISPTKRSRICNLAIYISTWVLSPGCSSLPTGAPCNAIQHPLLSLDAGAKEDICGQSPDNFSSPLTKPQLGFTSTSRHEEAARPSLRPPGGCSGGRSPPGGSGGQQQPWASIPARLGSQKGSPGDAHLFSHLHRTPSNRLTQGKQINRQPRQRRL